MSCRLAQTLAAKAAGDLLMAKKLGPCPDIDNAVIGFHAQQSVEKSIKAILALMDVDFPMMTHDLDLLLTLASDEGMELPLEIIGTTWLTPWATTYENGEAQPGRLDRRQTIAIGDAAVRWCLAELASALDNQEASSFDEIRMRLDTEPATLADFEAEYGEVREPDGEG